MLAADIISGKPMRHHNEDTPRIGDHICYYSDLSKKRVYYSDWKIVKSLADIFREIVDAWTQRFDS